MSDTTINRILALVIFLVPLVVYALTMAPTLVFWDSGEFIATAYILGIPHSPGTPLFTSRGEGVRDAAAADGGGGADQFFSVVCGSLAVLMCYLIAVTTLRFMYPRLKGGLGRFMTYAGPLRGPCILAFSDTHWLDSTETEVYALNSS